MDIDAAITYGPPRLLGIQNDFARVGIAVAPAVDDADGNRFAEKQLQRRRHVAIMVQHFAIGLRDLLRGHLPDWRQREAFLQVKSIERKEDIGTRNGGRHAQPSRALHIKYVYRRPMRPRRRRRYSIRLKQYVHVLFLKSIAGQSLDLIPREGNGNGGAFADLAGDVELGSMQFGNGMNNRSAQANTP